MKTGRICILAAAAMALAGCSTYGSERGYGRVSVGSSYGLYDRGYSGNSYYGWNDGYYYPGNGNYVYNRAGTRHALSRAQLRYWQARRAHLRRSEVRENWSGYEGNRRPAYRDQRREQRRDWRAERRVDRAERRTERVERKVDRAERRGYRNARPDIRPGARSERRADPQRATRAQRRDARRDARRGVPSPAYRLMPAAGAGFADPCQAAWSALRP